MDTIEPLLATPAARRVVPAADLLSGVGRRVPLSPFDGRSQVPMERVEIDGAWHVVKHQSPQTDWVMRATGDDRCRVRTMWETGLLDALPDCLDHTIEGVGYDDRTGTTTLLMRDASAEFVPEGDSVIEHAQHRRFLGHMATLHATFWGWRPDDVLTEPALRYTALSPATGRREREAGHTNQVPLLLEDAWGQLDQAAPQAAAVARALAEDPGPMVRAMAAGPQTFVHGDWKLGNLGTRPDGVTVLVDWAFPGRAPAPVDLAWYLAVNCDRLPESKEATIDAYREALEQQGVDTGPWWDRQLELALLGGFVQLGWNKTHAPDELAWWAERAVQAAGTL